MIFPPMNGLNQIEMKKQEKKMEFKGYVEVLISLK